MFKFIEIDCKIIRIFTCANKFCLLLFSANIVSILFKAVLMQSTSLTVLHFTCVFGCNLNSCKFVGRRTKSSNIAAKNPRKAQSENLQFTGLEKIRQFVYPHSSFTRGRVFHFTPFFVDEHRLSLFIREKSIEKQNTRRVWVCGVSDNSYFSKTGPNPMVLRITSDYNMPYSLSLTF